MKVGFGFGLWIGLLASLAIVTSTWLYRDPAHNIKDSVDSVMQKVSTGPTSPGITDKIAELERLNKLKESGAISEAEYHRLKSSIL